MSFENHIYERSYSLLEGDFPDGLIAFVDYDQEIVTFPLWNLSGQWVGYQTYRWDKEKVRQGDPREMRYFTYLPKQALGVYGLQYLRDGYTGPICLVEGIWVAIVGVAHGLPCVAVLGNNPKQLRNWLYSLPNKIIPLCQPDDAGRKLANMAPNNAIMLDGDLDDVLISKGLAMAMKIREEV